MPADDSFQEKTEKATPKRRGEAREEGNVARSMEINSATVLLVGILALYFLSGWMLSHMQWGIKFLIQQSPFIELSVEDLDNFAMIAIRFLLECVAPLAFIILVFGIVANVLQVGLMFNLKPLQPNFNKINPIEGFKRLFSMRSLVEFIKGLIKIFIVGYIAYLTIKSDFQTFYLLLDSHIPVIVLQLGKLAFKLVLKTTLILVILAILDYLYQRWEFEKNIRMSKQEIRDESRQSEGDPKVRGRIRALQRQIVVNAMIKELPEADVVITNPTQLAVALKYDTASMTAPKVVAKGARKMAERIRNIAVEHGIPIVENKELAQALFKTVDVGKEVPTKFYQAVAEVLSYVYRLKGKKFM
ncbi:flagellar biosynthesis protein FlhB [candidate division KSB1 bacterium]|nr:flagellar biosynthesis protein FlhB [candidate division KSB1 bacterium]